MVEMYTSATSFDQRHQMPSASEELDSTKTAVFAARLLFCVAGDASMCQLWRGQSWVVGGPQYQPTLIPTLWQRVPTIHERLRKVGHLFISTVCLVILHPSSSLLRAEAILLSSKSDVQQGTKVIRSITDIWFYFSNFNVLSHKLFRVPSDKVNARSSLHS